MQPFCDEWSHSSLCLSPFSELKTRLLLALLQYTGESCDPFPWL